MIFGREPAAWIGLIVTIIVGIVSTLAGQGFISDVLAGKVTDVVNAIAQILLLLSPLIAGLLIRRNVTPTANPTLPAGTAVTVAGTGQKTTI